MGHAWVDRAGCPSSSHRLSRGEVFQCQTAWEVDSHLRSLCEDGRVVLVDLVDHDREDPDDVRGGAQAAPQHVYLYGEV
jgi:hypothetical protein